jgi:trk system potassium uptake protein TrkH
MMMVFMFIGGASGSTAGGIKVNTVAVMLSYLVSTIREKDSVVLFRHSIEMKLVTRAFLILLFGMTVVVTGTILLTVFESGPVEHLFFEAVSAFGTVGLSAGVTPNLSVPGRLVVIVLMFLGRLGPLTILAAATAGEREVKIEYPRGDIAIG